MAVDRPDESALRSDSEADQQQREKAESDEAMIS
jgi:hypothetical protein